MNSFAVTLKKIISDRITAVAAAVVLFFLLTAIAAEVYNGYCRRCNLTPFYAESDPGQCYAPPAPSHWLGTDYQGRDVLFRALAGSNTALKVGLIAGGIATIIGLFLGVTAGYFGGHFDNLVVWLYTVFASMPTLLVVLAFSLLVSQEFLNPGIMKAVRWCAALLSVETGTLGIYCAIGVTGWVSLCRCIRGETMKLKHLPYVTAARIAGAGNLHIIIRHLLPNLANFTAVYFTMIFANAVMLEVIVSFLGLGSQNIPSWGIMISDGQSRLWAGVWWELAAATACLFSLILSLNILGDALRNAYEPEK